MTNRSARTAARIAFILSFLLVPAGVLRAQNENTSVGFQTNHAFEGAQFGDSIDVLNGSLTLVIPIGPRYQLNQNLGYQLQLSYGSKIWSPEAAEYADDHISAGLYRRSTMGLGFAMHFGRIYRDVEVRAKPDGNPGYFCDWYYVSPDGNQHLLPGDLPDARSCDNYPTSSHTVDNTFYTIGGTGALKKPGDGGWNCDPATAPPLSVVTPDGTRYTLAHYVSVKDGANAEYNCLGNAVLSTDDRYREYNRDFGGWYVTLIEDMRSQWTTESGYAVWVKISYEDNTTHPLGGFDHAIKEILDSAGRRITFDNHCAAPSGAATATGCDEIGILHNPGNRNAVRTDAISVPKFTGSSAVADTDAARATYNFAYVYDGSIRNLGNTDRLETAYRLAAIDYPTFRTHAQSNPPRYRMTFGYNLYGELETRTLPTGAEFSYSYNNYFYYGGALYGYATAGSTRAVYRKTLTLPDDPSRIHEWRYTRDATTDQGPASGTELTNPLFVTVKDPLGNETTYYFHASRSNASSSAPSYDPEDGWAPEWSDGANYRIEYYQGNGRGRKLLRSEDREYDADIWSGSHRSHRNVRVSRIATVYHDDGDRQSFTSFREWDGLGHWRVKAEGGDGIAGTRTTRTVYLNEDPDDVSYLEVSDGHRVLRRIDNVFENSASNRRARMIQSVRRGTLPGALGTPQATTGSPPALVVDAGDVNTTLTYDDVTGNVLVKEIADGTSVQQRIRLAWQNGQVVAKEFLDWSTGQYFPWKAIDRSLDGNTGLTIASRDSAGVQVTYTYDELGRLKDITPGDPEFPTEIEYVDISHTTVRQGDPAVMGGNYACSGGDGDYIMSCHLYDGLGRLIKTQRRPYNASNVNPDYPYQTRSYRTEAGGVTYEVGKLTFESEWTLPGQPEVGTTYDYRQPGILDEFDPFGRVRTVTTADGKVTQTRYFGPSSTVTVQGIQGPDNNPFNATTTYFRDAWNRLVEVRMPKVPAGSTLAHLSGGADAVYTYDLLDNLTLVELVDQKSQGRQKRTFDYDALNRVRTSWNPEGGTAAATAYDAMDHVTEQEDASGNRLIYTYDGAGRLKQLQRQGYKSTSMVVLRINTYDQAGAFGSSNGKLTTAGSYDEGGAWSHIREIYYGGLNGRVSSERNFYNGWSDTDPAPINTTYNSFGLPDSTVYPEGMPGKGGAFSVTYRYANGYPIEVWDPSQPSVSQAKVTYSPAGVLKEVITHGNVRTLIDPDIRNRPRQIDIAGWNGSDFLDYHYRSGLYQYDGAGNIYRIGSSEYGYDAANRLVRAKDFLYDDLSNAYDLTQTRLQTFTYDDYGNMTQKQTWDASDIMVANDRWGLNDWTTETSNPLLETNRNRIIDLTYMTQNNEDVTRLFTYDPRGNLTVSDRQSSKQIYRYDIGNRILSVSTSSGSLLTQVANFNYDADSNRTSKDNIARGLRTFFVRDAAGRLMSEFRRPSRATSTPEWTKHYLYLGSRLVALRENLIPQPPGGLTAATTSTSAWVTLSWQPNPSDESASIASYRVWRSTVGSGAWSPLATTSNVTYTDSGAVAGTWYTYVVTAIDSAGRESYASDSVTVQAKDTTAPQTPGGLVATPGDSVVSLRWTENPPLNRVVGYHVYRNNTRITGGPVPYASYTDVDLAIGTYTYAVTAVDTRTESTKSVSVEVTLGDLVPPGTVSRVLATPDCTGQSSIRVTWIANGLPDPGSRYLVYRSPAFTDQVGLPPGARDAAAQESYTDTETVPGATYTYTVAVQDAAGNSSPSSIQSTATARYPAGAVAAPASPAAEAGDGWVTLRIATPPDALRTHTINVYKKINADVGCENYELLGSLAGTAGQCTGMTVCPASGCPPGSGCHGGFCGSSLPCSSDSDCGTGETCKPRYAELLDGTAINNVAYDYAATQVDSLGRESTLSAPTLAIPVGRPQNYRECVEDLGTTFADGAYNCGFTKVCSVARTVCSFDSDCPPGETCTQVCAISGTPCSSNAQCPGDACVFLYHYKRLVVRWNRPAGRVYQPYSATNADGTIGYLKGFRIYQYETPSIGASDTSTLEPMRQDSSSGSGFCSSNFSDCVMDSDCLSGSTCQDAQADPYLIQSGDTRVNEAFRNPITAYGCLSAKAVHKVFANGNWQTVESGFSDNFNVKNKVDYSMRCLPVSPDICQDFTPTVRDPDPPICPKDSDLPPVPAAPTATAPTGEPGKVAVSWAAPPVGVCELVTPRGCWMSCAQSSCPCPIGQVCRPCKVGEPCGGTDGLCILASQATCNADSGCPPTSGCLSSGLNRCSASRVVCTLDSDCPVAGETCTPEDDCAQFCESRGVSGYYIYADEQNSQQFHFVLPAPYTPADLDTLSVAITGLSPWKNSRTPNSFAFKVATVDAGGSVSDPSPSSNSVQPRPKVGSNQIPVPASLKTVIWTVNDAIVEPTGGGLWAPVRNPRDMDGIKLAWRPGGIYSSLLGYRVWRSRTKGCESCYCALLQNVEGQNPVDVRVCPNDNNGTIGNPNAASATLTTQYRLYADLGLFFLDRTVLPDVVYYYKVTAVTSAGESIASDEVAGLALSHPAPPLSPPAMLRAYTRFRERGIYLRWCPNPSVEGVDGYKVYRSSGPDGARGPYTPLLPIPLPLGCLTRNTRCEIKCPAGTTTPCPVQNLELNMTTCSNPGPEGDCKVVDLTVANLREGGQTLTQEADYNVYYYVVTAVRDGAESGFSNENTGWPDYCPASGSCTEDRYDSDNFPDTPCGDENALLAPPPAETPPTRVADGDSAIEAASGTCDGPQQVVSEQAPYRTIGVLLLQPLPTPSAVPRFVYYHLDHLGSPRVLVDASGTVLSTHRYLPFGEENPVNAMSSANKRQFTGHERDQESGLDYMVARYYSAASSRLYSADPLMFQNIVEKKQFSHIPQNWNKYSYALNNPLQFIDGNGRTVMKSPGYSNAVATNSGFAAGHAAFLNNPEGKRIYTKFDQNKKVVVLLDIGTEASLTARNGGKSAVGLTSAGNKLIPAQSPQFIHIWIAIDAAGSIVDQIIYHEFRHAENAYDYAGSPIARDIMDQTLDEDPYGAEGMSSDMVFFNSLRVSDQSSSGRGSDGFWAWADAGLEDYNRRRCAANPDPLTC